MILATLCLLLGTGGWLWQQAHTGLGKIEEELQAAVRADQWIAARNGRMDDTQRDGRPKTTPIVHQPEESQIQLLDLGADWALVQVTTRRGELSFRQTRLFRKGPNGWYAATPSAAFLGALHIVETTHFVFHYYALDNHAVTEAATKLDALYPAVAASYPIEPAQDGKRQIWVSPDYSLPGTGHTTPHAALQIASPTFYLLPTEVSDGDFLAQAVLVELLIVFANDNLEHLFSDGSYNYQIRARMQALLNTLSLWQLWNTEMSLASLHEPTIQWIYGNAQVRRAPPAADAKLCVLHQLWRTAPEAIQLPLFCGDPQQLKQYEVGRYLPYFPPRSLAETRLFATTSPDEPHGGLVDPELVGLVTVFDYAATTYGRQSLALLIANAASYSTWEALIPVTFGVPHGDFEHGWQAYLRNRYEVSAPVAP